MTLARHSSLFWLTSVTLVLAVVLGGSTRPGFVSDAILQALSVPLLLVAVASLPQLWEDRRARGPLVLLLLIVLLPLLQLLPLPPELWTKLPGRDIERQSFEILGDQLPWMPASVSPAATMLAALSLATPVAIFLATLQLDEPERPHVTLVLVIIGGISVCLGFLQVAQGPNSALRFYEVTFKSDAVGFFANRNHFSAFVNCLIVFCAAWTLYIFSFKDDLPSVPSPTAQSSKYLALGILLTTFISLIAAQAMARSRAGLFLTMLSLVAVWLLSFSSQRKRTARHTAKFAYLATGLAAVLVLQFGLYRILSRFSADPLADARFTIAKNTWASIRGLFPFGSGLGAFSTTYATAEPTADTLIDTYINHAHNEFLQIAFEGSAYALVLLALALLWFCVKFANVSVIPASSTVHPWRLFNLACATVAVLLAAHSITDYPLRTGAGMAIFAVALAILVATSRDTVATAPNAKTWTKQFEVHKQPASPGHAVNAKPSWSTDVDWPPEW